jgi:hypothetical protein
MNLNLVGTTLAHWAAKNGYYAFLKVLLDHGVNIKDKDKAGNTPLMYATAAALKEPLNSKYPKVIRPLFIERLKEYIQISVHMPSVLAAIIAEYCVDNDTRFV